MAKLPIVWVKGRLPLRRGSYTLSSLPSRVLDGDFTFPEAGASRRVIVAVGGHPRSTSHMSVEKRVAGMDADEALGIIQTLALSYLKAETLADMQRRTLNGIVPVTETALARAPKVTP